MSNPSDYVFELPEERLRRYHLEDDAANNTIEPAGQRLENQYVVDGQAREAIEPAGERLERYNVVDHEFTLEEQVVLFEAFAAHRPATGESRDAHSYAIVVTYNQASNGPQRNWAGLLNEYDSLFYSGVTVASLKAKIAAAVARSAPAVKTEVKEEQA